MIIYFIIGINKYNSKSSLYLLKRRMMQRKSNKLPVQLRPVSDQRLKYAVSGKYWLFYELISNNLSISFIVPKTTNVSVSNTFVSEPGTPIV